MAAGQCTWDTAQRHMMVHPQYFLLDTFSVGVGLLMGIVDKNRTLTCKYCGCQIVHLMRLYDLLALEGE